MKSARAMLLAVHVASTLKSSAVADDAPYLSATALAQSFAHPFAALHAADATQRREQSKKNNLGQK